MNTQPEEIDTNSQDSIVSEKDGYKVEEWEKEFELMVANGTFWGSVDSFKSFMELEIRKAEERAKKAFIDENIARWVKVFDYHSDMSNERHSAMRNVARTEISILEALKK